MAEIVNLRMARKAKARAAERQDADAARARHGRTKGEKRATQAEIARIDRAVEGAKRETGED
ncbi:MAG TPA: DUF4169 family protein [Novosphingobium sp.]|nr:DUF4169 family protein [Novosphingobium sp.]